MKDFFIGVRNTVALIFSWLVIVWLVAYSFFGSRNIALNTLWQILTLSLSWAVIYAFFYKTQIFTLKKFTPTLKFTLFLVSCTLIESLLIYAFGLFGFNTIVRWGVFVGVVFILYALSLGIFQIYKRSAREEYSRLLQDFQQEKEEK